MGGWEARGRVNGEEHLDQGAARKGSIKDETEIWGQGDRVEVEKSGLASGVSRSVGPLLWSQYF